MGVSSFVPKMSVNAKTSLIGMLRLEYFFRGSEVQEFFLTLSLAIRITQIL
jgi:hypothetical protein